MKVIIEPHADDAFLSLGGHIDQWIKSGEQVLIVTVYSGTRKRALDAQNYARTVNASWFGMEFDEEDTEELTAKSFWDKIAEVKKIHKFKLNNLIFPLGLQHHDHYFIADLARKNNDRYLDTPYHTKQKNHEEVNEKMVGRKVVSFMKPHARKWRHIPLFKDQAKFFYYNPKEALVQCIELILK